MYLMSFSESTLERLWVEAAKICPTIPGFDFSTGFQYFETIQNADYSEYRLVVFRGIISGLEVIGNYFKFETKYGGTLLFEIGYIHHGTIIFEKDQPCEIIYQGGIIGMNRL